MTCEDTDVRPFVPGTSHRLKLAIRVVSIGAATAQVRQRDAAGGGGVAEAGVAGTDRGRPPQTAGDRPVAICRSGNKG
jgi:hypothetical protein